MKSDAWIRLRSNPDSLSGRDLLFGVFQTHFVLCTMFGLIVLDTVIKATGSEEELRHEIPPFTTRTALFALGVALVCWLATWLVHFIRVYRRRRRGASAEEIRSLRRIARVGGLVGFACGLLDVFYIFFPWTIIPLTLVVVWLIIGAVRVFLAHAMIALRPNNYPRWSDVAELIFIFVNVLAMFTVLALALGKEAWGGNIKSVLDAFYFSVVMMTTVGFGDISPQAPLARFLVAIACVTSYLLFALMVGILTRGILTPDEDSP